MFGLLGIIAIVSGVISSIFLIVQGIRAARGFETRLNRPANTLLWSGITAMGALEGAIIFNDFTIEYVANHHSSATPFPFNVASAWSAMEGSMILWCLILAGFTWLTYRRYASRPDRLGAAAVAVMAIVAVFFFLLAATVSNPFETCTVAAERSCLMSNPVPFVDAVAPADGFGPNPLLQNHLLMAIHPPILYLGYVGLTVPFAYAISALALAAPGNEWLLRAQKSALVAWSFLTVGIVLGSWWAYEVLSWGGWWEWDPIENATLIPWLTTTAFLHSAIVQIRRGSLQAWNLALVILTFSLTILGTFLTRSGTIVSVHSFTQSLIGPLLLGFLSATVIASFGLLYWRAPVMAQPSKLSNILSREGAVVLNNILLGVFALMVLVGTTYPIILEALTGEVVRVGPPFYNRFSSALGVAILLAMSIGSVTPWRHAERSLLWRRLRTPVQVALVSGFLAAWFVSRNYWVVSTVVLGVLYLGILFRGVWVQVSSDARTRHSRLLAEVGKSLRNDLSAWGGRISHLGLVIVVVAISLTSNLSEHTQADLAPEQSLEIAGYSVSYQGAFTSRESNRLVVAANLIVSRDGHIIAQRFPSLNEFTASGQVIGSPAVYSSLTGNLYLAVYRIDEMGALIAVDFSPGQWYMWVGGFLIALGGILRIWTLRSGRNALGRVDTGIGLGTPEPPDKGKPSAIGVDCFRRSLKSDILAVQRDLTELESQIASGEISSDAGSDLRRRYQSDLESAREKLNRLEATDVPGPRVRKRTIWRIALCAIVLSLFAAAVSYQIQTSQSAADSQVPDSMTLDSLSPETLEAILLQYDLISETPAQIADELSRIRFVVAERRFNEGRLDLAFDHYDRIIRSDAPTDISAVSLTRLAWIVWVGSGEPEPALALLDRSLQLMPDSIDALYMQGRLVWCGLGDFDRAAGLFESLLNRDDLDPATRELVTADLEEVSQKRGCG